MEWRCMNSVFLTHLQSTIIQHNIFTFPLFLYVRFLLLPKKIPYFVVTFTLLGIFLFLWSIIVCGMKCQSSSSSSIITYNNSSYFLIYLLASVSWVIQSWFSAYEDLIDHWFYQYIGLICLFFSQRYKQATTVNYISHCSYSYIYHRGQFW